MPSQIASARASTPSDVLDDTAITGMPSIDDSFPVSMEKRLRDSSILVSARMAGTRSSMTSRQRAMPPERSVESTTTTMESSRPDTRSLTTTFSSSESPDSAYVPGRSCTMTVVPLRTTAPSLNSTVVPG